MPPPGPVPEIPLASRPCDPALYALRRSDQREIQIEMTHMRAEHEFLNARRAELDARESRIETLYRTMFPESSTASGTPEAPQALQAPAGPAGFRGHAGPAKLNRASHGE